MAGLRPPTCWTIFGSNANPLNILVHLQLYTVTSRLSIQSVAPSATVWRQFICQVTATISNTPPFGGCSIWGITWWSLLRHPPLGGRLDIGSRKWYQWKCRPHTFPFDFSAHYGPTLHRFAQYTTRQTDRQNDRNRPPMLYISGLKTLYW